MIDPASWIYHPALGLAFIFDVPAAMVVQFGLVIDLRLVVLLGDLGLKVRVTLRDIHQFDYDLDEAVKLRAIEPRQDQRNGGHRGEASRPPTL